MTLAEVKQTVKAALNNEDFNVKFLENILNIAKKVYYNGEVDGMSSKAVSWFKNNITDTVFDELEDILMDFKPNSKYFKNNTGAPIGNAKERKVKLPVPMPSLNKLKPDSKNLSKFLAKGPFVISAKLDGVSVLIQTKGKKLYTRGNGSVGQDISHLWEALRLPTHPKGDYTLRAEMIIPKEVFETNKKAFSIGGKEAKNARNTMSGLVNAGKVSKALKHVDVLGYWVLGKKPSDAFPLIKKLGFKVPFWKMLNSLNVDSLNTYLGKVKDSKYEADGLVVSKDIVEKPTSENPSNTLAFKNNQFVETKEFIVKDVIWQPSKHGLLKPVLSLEPQMLDGVTVKRCTAFNGQFVKDNKIGPGARVQLVRSGGVIPHVLKVTKKTKAQFPKDYVWNGVDIALPDSDDNETVQVKKTAAFFKHLGAEGISGKFFEKLYEEGYDNLKDILTMTKRDILNLPGVQEKSANTIFNQIQKVKTATLADYMAASGCFPSTIASTRINRVLEKYPDILEFKPKAMALQIAAIPGFSSITVDAFVSGAGSFKKWFKNLKGILHIKKKEKTKVKGSKCKGMFICPTGFRFDSSLSKYIEENGGTLQASISKTTTHLVTKDPNSGSSKITKAEKLGVKVLSLEKFKKLIKYTG